MLEQILSAEFTSAAQLRNQPTRTEATAVRGPDPVSVDLRVREPCEHAAPRLARTDRGATLAALELAWVTDEMPTSLPAVLTTGPAPTSHVPENHTLDLNQT
ncbi:hypothetical protein GCM10010305_58600 [Streptomyces termitum]|uniref:Uncharacterized protein n=1 Tax=Streptomyces termitum TaxID=67368 RepID=A0A918WDL6_9ACTN|nr:hypothetical protein GCM10010305_58600 [Streptomyces termitum]